MKRRLIRLPEVRLLCGMSRSSIYTAISTAQFPRPVRIGIRSVAWPTDEIEQIIAARIAGLSCAEVSQLVSELEYNRKRIGGSLK